MNLSRLARNSRFGLYALLFSALLSASGARGQMLARPGWAGSGMNIESWWTHAVTYAVDPHDFASAGGGATGDLRGVASHLEYIRSLGVDAIVLTNFAPPQGEPATRYQAIDPAIGTLDDFDDLVREASRDGMRLVVELDPQQISDPSTLSRVARFWLTRSVGGIALRSAKSGAVDASQRATQVRTLRELTKSFAGLRILIDEAIPGDTSASQPQHADLTLNTTLTGITAFNAAAVRAAMQSLQNESKNTAILSATDIFGLPRSAARYGDSANDPAIAKVLATVLFGTRANVQVYFGQEVGLTGKPGSLSLMPWGVPADPAAKKPATTGPDVAAEEADSDSLLNWYRRLIDLHHGNATLRSGTTDLLNHDADNALVWISRRGVASYSNPPIVVICNLSAKPLKLSLTEDMKNLHLRGNFLRTVLRSDPGMGGMSLDAITLQPFGVYMGELRF